jgi:hypothetical protein
MKKSRIAIRPIPTPECVVSLAPAISALKKKHPGAAVGLVADEHLREASHLLPELDFFATEAENTHADHVIDLMGADRFDDSAEHPGWKAYLLAARGTAFANPYHLADLLKKTADVDTVDVNFELAIPEPPEALPEALVNAGGVRVAVCAASLGAEAVEAVLTGLARLPSPAEVFLLGTVKDKRVSSPASAAWDGKLNVHDLCGRQSLLAHAAVLRGCDLTIAGPGLSSVLSAGYGTFTVCVDESADHAPLLYPYGHGHLVVQRANSGEFGETLASFVQEIVNHALTANSGSVPTLEQWQAFADAMIFGYLGKIRLMATQRIEIVFKDTGSFTELYQRPLLFTGSEIEDVLGTFYRLLWEHALGGRTITTYDLQVLHTDTMTKLCDLLKPIEQLYELGAFGRTYSGYVRESLSAGDIERAKHESARLQEVEELMQALTSAHPSLLSLYAVFRQEQRLLEGATPLALAEEMASLFESLQARVLVLLDLAKSLFHTVFENESALNSTDANLRSGAAALGKADSDG